MIPEAVDANTGLHLFYGFMTVVAIAAYFFVRYLEKHPDLIKK